MTSVSQQLRTHGQSLWLDYISRDLIRSGRLAQLIGDGTITGMTSNPTIFDKAIASSAEYEEQLQKLIRGGESDAYAAFLAIARDDITAAADLLRPVYDEANGADGYISLEVPPGIEHDRDATVAEALRLFALVGRPNLMIKVPGTPAGVQALAELIAAGVNVNVTLLFAVEVYERVAEAYVQGLERRLAAGDPLDAVASVASFFVSRVDTAADAGLAADSLLRGQLAVANARVAYGRFQQIFSGPRWQPLAEAGARVQRPLWASTGTKNPAYSDVLYVDELIAPDTVNTLPEATLAAVLDHGTAAPTIVPAIANAEETLREAAAAGVDIGAITSRLLEEGLDAFARDFQSLLDNLQSRIASAPSRFPFAAVSPGPIAPAITTELAQLANARIIERIWARDHTVWSAETTEITDRLGWLDVVDAMIPAAAALQDFGREMYAAGFRHAVLLGMGGSSLGAEVLARSCPGAGLELHVLDTTDPREVRDLEARIGLDQTLFLVASKSGTTIEPRAILAYFWDRLPVGDHYIAITDPSSDLNHLARERKFRRTFVNSADIGGRYSGLSYFGLVPAALAGVNIAQLLWRAREMVEACREPDPARNPGAWLGAAIAVAAAAGRDKLTLVTPPAVASFGDWVEQLIAESTGKGGTGIIPVVGEPFTGADAYGADRCFVGLGPAPELDAISDAGHPVIELPYTGPMQLGAEFVRWEFATAIAGQVMDIHPFDQPNVEEAKREATRALGESASPIATPPAADILAMLVPGDYLGLTAFLPRTAENVALLKSARDTLRARHGVAVTIGFGPRYLHSTGQLHKGGPNSAVVLQVTDRASADEDLRVPGSSYTLGQLEAAQADGDLLALLARGRRVARLSPAELQALL